MRGASLRPIARISLFSALAMALTQRGCRLGRVRDLLAPRGKQQGEVLRIRESPVRGPYLEGIVIKPITGVSPHPCVIVMSFDRTPRPPSRRYSRFCLNRGQMLPRHSRFGHALSDRKRGAQLHSVYDDYILPFHNLS